MPQGTLAPVPSRRWPVSPAGRGIRRPGACGCRARPPPCTCGGEAYVVTSPLEPTRRRRRGGPSGVADPAVARPGGGARGRRRRLATRVRGGRADRGGRARPRLVDRGLLARAEGPAGRRVVAARRDPLVLLLAPQGGGRAGAGCVRGRSARRAHAPGADLQARGRLGDPAAVHRAAAAVAALRARLLPVLPRPKRLGLQAVHSLDVGEAYRLVATSPDARAPTTSRRPGARPKELGRILGARTVGLPKGGCGPLRR